MEKTTYIYALRDPRTDEVCYIGKTDDPERRWRRHRKETGETRRHIWLKELREAGLAPILEILEKVSYSKWAERESWWIQHLRASGCNLTNMTSGGNGAVGFSPTIETRQKISESVRKGWKENPRTISESHLAALVAGRRATPQSVETRAKIRKAHLGKVLSEETCRKISRSKTGVKYGPPSIETRKKISGAVRGEKNGMAKLTMDKARAIRRRYAEGDISLKQLGAKYEVDPKQIHRIVRNEAWLET